MRPNYSVVVSLCSDAGQMEKQRRWNLEDFTNGLTQAREDRQGETTKEYTLTGEGSPAFTKLSPLHLNPIANYINFQSHFSLP